MQHSNVVQAKGELTTVEVVKSPLDERLDKSARMA